jgi:hypothetical protein
MTKADALAKYILDSSYMTSYSSNQLVPKSTWVAANSVTFSSWYSRTITDGEDSTSGTVTITGANAVFRAQSIVNNADADTSTLITINGTSRNAVRATPGTTNSTTFTVSPGTYSYSISVTVNGVAGQGAITWTQ